MVPALRLIVNENIRSLDSAPRITEEIPDIYPQEISCQQREGRYLDVDLAIPEDDEDKPRLLLEQLRWADLDGDDYDEPYIVTVDKESQKVLRVESNFSQRDIKWDQGKPVRITPGKFYVKYGFFPHPQGKFYDIGLGHLLKRIGAVIDTCINQMIDAGNAKVAGGGFIASGLRLQGRAGRSVLRSHRANTRRSKPPPTISGKRSTNANCRTCRRSRSRCSTSSWALLGRSPGSRT
jgi:chaperonin GroES